MVQQETCPATMKLVPERVAGDVMILNSPLVKENVVDRPIAIAIEDVLLVVGHHCHGIARGRPGSRCLGPDVMEKRRIGWAPVISDDVMDRTLAVAIENVLLVVCHHCHGIPCSGP